MNEASTTSPGPAAGPGDVPPDSPVGVYVHFPYCRRRCAYCDFDIHVRRTIRHQELAEAVCRELDERAAELAGRRLLSLYVGGGTPSLWEPACVARVAAHVAARGVRGLDLLEVTFEVNPEDLPEGMLPSLRAAGVNRLSIGAQSFDARRLRQLGRLHGPDEVARAVTEARRAGFGSLSLDLMHGLPAQRPEELHAELDALLALAPDHVSAYQLTVEERTPFGAYARRGQLDPVDDERGAELSGIVEERLAAAGYQHYEVSNYARPGHRAVHNDLYWSGGEWIGLGPAAHSFRRLPDGGGERRENPRQVDRYLVGLLGRGALGPGRSLLDEPARHARLSADELAREAMWLGLRRLVEGVDRAAFAARFGEDPRVRFAAILEPLLDGALVEEQADRLRLTPRGAQLADEVALRFL